MAIADYGIDYIKIAPSMESDLSGYYKCSSTTEGALEVIADSATLAEGKIKISSVTPYKSSDTLAVGDYVLSVSKEVGSFVDFEDTAVNTIVGIPTFKVSAIVKDSFSYTDTAPTENNIEIEDSDDYFATIKTDGGTKGFTLQTYDMSEDAYQYLMGFTKNGIWNEEAVKFDIPNQCVELRTRPLDGFPAKVYQYARMSVRISRTGTIGKSGFPNFQLEFTKLGNYNAAGEEISGMRWQLPS